MADLKQIVVRRLTECQQQIQQDMAALGINASGRSSRAFRVVVTENGVQLIYGSEERHAPLETLEIGRPAGDVPGGFVLTKSGIVDVSKKFKSILIHWADEKGFQLGWGGATMLGRRIAEQGTIRHTEPQDVYSTNVQRTADALNEDLPRQVRAEIQTALNY